MNKDKERFIQRYEQLVKEQQFEEALKDQPIFEDQLGMLGYDVVSANSDMVRDLRDRGLIVRRPFPTLQEFVSQAKGYVVLQSTVFQMEKEEYSKIRKTGLLNKGIEIYNDLEQGQVPLHFDWTHKAINGQLSTSYTGGSNMLNVIREALDLQESEARATEIRSVQLNYKQARQEIDWVLNNLEALVEGTVSTQYHDSINRDHRTL
jgi:hypothetical protein